MHAKIEPIPVNKNVVTSQNLMRLIEFRFSIAFCRINLILKSDSLSSALYFP